MLGECTSSRSAYVAGLEYLSKKLESCFAVLSLELGCDAFTHHVEDDVSQRQTWHRHCDGMMLKSRYHLTAQGRFFQPDEVDGRYAILSVPLKDQESHNAVGAMAIVIACEGREAAAARLSELQATADAIDKKAAALRPEYRPTGDGGAIAKVAAHQSPSEFCFALANSLKVRMSCDQAAIGLVRGNKVRVACISGFDDLYPRSPGSKLIQQAMCECLDAGAIVRCQPESASGDGIAAAGHLIHKRWYSSVGASPVASVPLYVNDQCVAVISLRNSAGSSFDRDQLTTLQELISPLMPGLLLLQRANRSAFQHASESFCEFIKSFCRPGGLRRKLLAMGIVFAGVWVTFGKIEYRIAAPCTVESQEAVRLSAPFEGVIAESLVQPGDEVVANQPIARMDVQTLEAELAKLRSELRAAEAATIESARGGHIAIAEKSRAEAEIARIERCRDPGETRCGNSAGALRRRHS